MSQLPISPALVLSALLATGYAAAFHLVFGGSVRRLGIYLVAAWVGFALGQWIGGVLPLPFLDIGAVHAAVASLGCVFALFLTRWLAQLPPMQSQEKSQENGR